jgi:lactoylglutathione lyase
MNFRYTILYVHDVEATLTFYERVFGLKRRMLAPTKEYGELETGGTRLAFARIDFVKTLTNVPFEEPAPHKPAPPIELGLVTSEVEAKFAHAVKSGAVEVKRPEKKPWGQIVAYVRDLNGYLVEICSPID